MSKSRRQSSTSLPSTGFPGDKNFDDYVDVADVDYDDIVDNDVDEDVDYDDDVGSRLPAGDENFDDHVDVDDDGVDDVDILLPVIKDWFFLLS